MEGETQADVRKALDFSLADRSPGKPSPSPSKGGLAARSPSPSPNKLALAVSAECNTGGYPALGPWTCITRESLCRMQDDDLALARLLQVRLCAVVGCMFVRGGPKRPMQQHVAVGSAELRTLKD